MCGTRLYAQPPLSFAGTGDSAELAKKLSNPISDLVSIDAINRRDVRMIEGRQDTRFAH